MISGTTSIIVSNKDLLCITMISVATSLEVESNED